ncbi:MAG: winged helix-turn-helix domain-containing protein, partial [Ginsengibacter sp.]
MGNPITELIKIDTSLAIPVYKQIVQSVCRNIDNGVLLKGDVLPSVNKISEQFSLARGSVFTAYNDLRASGLIDSIPGKGYFVSGTETKKEKRIFLLFNTFTSYKEALFNALLAALPKSWTLHIYFHHHDIKTFETLLTEQAGYYNVFIIMPEVDSETPGILARLDSKKVFLLDVGYKEYKKEYPGVYQNLEKDMYSTLLSNIKLVSKYKRLFLVTSSSRAKDMALGFGKFSKKSNIVTGIRETFISADVKKGDAYIFNADDDLVELIKLVNEKKWQLGKDIGVISCNENNLMSVIGNGITTLSTDLEAMGKTISSMV